MPGLNDTTHVGTVTVPALHLNVTIPVTALSANFGRSIDMVLNSTTPSVGQVTVSTTPATVYIVQAASASGGRAACVGGRCSPLLAAAAVAGDPHIRGPLGHRQERASLKMDPTHRLFCCSIDFYGQAGGSYMLVDAPQFAVTMTLSRETVVNHYIGKVNITFHNISFTLSTAPLYEVHTLNTLLRSAGGKASFGKLGRFQLHIELCPGVSITVLKMMRQ